MNFEQILLSLVKAQLNMTEEQVAELLYQPSEENADEKVLKPDALQVLLDKDVARVAELRKTADTSEIFTQAYNKAKGEERSKIEKALATKYGVDKGEHNLENFIDAIITNSVNTQVSDKGITDDKVKAHPMFVQMEADFTNQITALKEAHTTELDKIKQGKIAETIAAGAVSTAMSYFSDLNPVLSKDANRAANQRNTYKGLFDQYDWEDQGEGKDPLPMKDGKRLEDAHGNAINLKQLSFNLANQYFDLQVQTQKKSTNNNNDQDDQGNPGTITVPKDEDALAMALLEAEDSATREAIQTAYDEANASS